ncbi:Ig-like domain-containing protein [Corallococcus interemptor]|nr:Ig-like domain-containing protein [Corallococcus interemptor]
MTNSHSTPTLALLGNGRALMVDYVSEVYNPTANTWAATPARSLPRFSSTLVALADGRALAVGGALGAPSTPYANVDIYEPQTNTWAVTTALNQPRKQALATRLADGRVLVVGGFNASNMQTRSAELFQPATGTWTPVPTDANFPHYADDTITLLADGRVMLVNNMGVELFDPATNTFAKVGTSANGRYDHVAARLPDGRVLLTGGSRNTSELFDPVLLQFTPTGAMLVPNRHFAAAAVMADGTVLVAGGHDGVATTFGSIERYHPDTGTWTQEPDLLQKRHRAAMVQLGSGDALVVGGAYRIGAYSDMSINGAQAAERLFGSCMPQSCAAQGKTCGTVSDGCGGTLECGTCGEGQSCSAANVCVCAPTTCAAQGRTCGPVSDGCGGTLACGSCGAGEVCAPGPGACVAAPEGHALYDVMQGAPVCPSVASGCDSDALLVGRGPLGPELHAPNTVAASPCADGTAGTFHVDASLDRLEVKTLDGSPLQAGRTVQVNVTLWNASAATRVDLFSAASANSPNWVLQASLTPGAATGAQVLSATYVLPVGSRQVLRGIVRDDGPGTPIVECSSSPYADHDDLVFQVDSADDTTAPVLAITSPVTDTVAKQRVVQLQASATDNLAVQRVEFHLQTHPPDGALTLLAVDTVPPYTASWDPLSTTASSFKVVARGYDFAGNRTEVSRTYAIDNTPPSVAITSPANGATVSGTVTLTATAQDAFGIQGVSFYLDGAPLGTVQTPPYTVFWNTATSTLGTHQLHAIAQDGLGNLGISSLLTVTISSGPPPGPRSAVYDANWKTPACLGTPGSACDSVALLTGRGGLGPEPHAPNTVFGTCADGPYGVFHSDESVDQLVVSTVDGGTLRPGALVKATATVWAFSTTDVLDLYSAPNAASPVWTFMGTATPQSSGVQKLSVTFPLPSSAAGGIQAVRAVFRYGGSRSACPNGSYDDKDDLVFSVQ